MLKLFQLVHTGIKREFITTPNSPLYGEEKAQ